MNGISVYLILYEFREISFITTVSADNNKTVHRLHFCFFSYMRISAKILKLSPNIAKFVAV